jgi:FkbM family methyltransferase
MSKKKIVLRKSCLFDKIRLKIISNINRHKQFETSILSFKFKVADSASFVAQVKEILFRKIYYFTTEKNTPFIIDCGANIGVSVLFFYNLNPHSEIIAFEPDRVIFDILSTNINRLNSSSIQLINSAVWSECGQKIFEIDGADGGRVLYEPNIGEKSLYQVNTVKLSSYITKNVDFLKIDIEGAEVDVIQEIESKLYLVRNVFIEFHTKKNEIQKLDLLLNILNRNNFRYYIEHTGESLRNPFIDRSKSHMYDNLINIFAINNNCVSFK